MTNHAGTTSSHSQDTNQLGLTFPAYLAADTPDPANPPPPGPPRLWLVIAGGTAAIAVAGAVLAGTSFAGAPHAARHHQPPSPHPAVTPTAAPTQAPSPTAPGPGGIPAPQPDPTGTPAAIPSQAPSPPAPSQSDTPAPPPGPTVTPTATPTATPTQAPSPTAPSGDAAYVQDIQNAGIAAPASWILSTGQTLCADWAAGQSSSDTDSSILLPGGILPGAPGDVRQHHAKRPVPLIAGHHPFRGHVGKIKDRIRTRGKNILTTTPTARRVHPAITGYSDELCRQEARTGEHLVTHAASCTQVTLAPGTSPQGDGPAVPGEPRRKQRRAAARARIGTKDETLQ